MWRDNICGYDAFELENNTKIQSKKNETLENDIKRYINITLVLPLGLFTWKKQMGGLKFISGV